MTYRIEIETTLRHYVTLEADNPATAIELAKAGAIEPENISDPIEIDAKPVNAREIVNA